MYVAAAATWRDFGSHDLGGMSVITFYDFNFVLWIKKTEMDKVVISSSQQRLQVLPHDVVVYQSTRADFQSSKKY